MTDRDDEPTCPVDSCDATGTALCSKHTRELRTALEQLVDERHALLAELEVTVTRQDRGTGMPLYAMNRRKVWLPGVHYPEGDSALPSTAWPFAWDASNVAWTARNTLAAWAVTATLALPGIGAVVAARVLLSSLPGLVDRDDAGQLHDEITGLHRDVLEAIDRQQPDLYAGLCDAPDVRVHAETPHGPSCSDLPGCRHVTCAAVRAFREGRAPLVLTPFVSRCGAKLYGRLGRETIMCRACGAEYSIADRRRQMLDDLEENLAPVRQVAEALSELERQVTVKQIDGWRERGMITTYGCDSTGRNLVKVAEVRAHLAVVAERKRAPSARRKITAA